MKIFFYFQLSNAGTNLARVVKTFYTPRRRAIVVAKRRETICRQFHAVCLCITMCRRVTWIARRETSLCTHICIHLCSFLHVTISPYLSSLFHSTTTNWDAQHKYICMWMYILGIFATKSPCAIVEHTLVRLYITNSKMRKCETGKNSRKFDRAFQK